MSAASLSEFEQGRRVPRKERLTALSSYLDVSLDDSEENFGDWRTFEPMRLHPVQAAAVEVFTVYGYHAATVRMIADRSGTSLASVYHRATNKQGLLIELLRMAMAELTSRCEAARDDADSHSGRGQLINLVECLVLFHVHRRELGFVATSEERSLEPAARDELRAARTHVREMVGDAVRELNPGRQADDPATDVVARAIVTMCVAVADSSGFVAEQSADDLARQYSVLAVRMAGGAC